MPRSASARRRVCRRGALILALGLVAAASPSRAQSPAADAAGTVIHLQERAERSVKRDRLTATLRVEAENASATVVQTEINRRMTAALERAKSVPAVTVATGGYSVYQQGPSSAAAPRWHGVQTLSLSARETVAVLDLAGALQQDGLVMSALVFDVTPEAAKAVEQELADQALRQLQDRAQHIAATLGMKVARLRDLRVGNAATAPPVPRMMFAAGVSSTTPPPAAEPGESVISVTVDAEIITVK